MKDLQPLKFKQIASDWITELADLHEWAPMEVDEMGEEPMQFVKDMVAFFTRGAILNAMRKK